ncbi:MAG: hypothetical protein QOD12_501 [Verrucomicrobiota bacterium]
MRVDSVGNCDKEQTSIERNGGVSDPNRREVRSSLVGREEPEQKQDRGSQKRRASVTDDKTNDGHAFPQ